MQKSTVVILVVILIVILAMFSSLLGAGDYATFADATAKKGENVTIIGELNKSKAINYDPTINANKTEFFVIDKAGVEKKVVFHDAKPRDIEKSEEITMEGRIIKGDFHAVHILLKCPSKYEAEKIGLKEDEGKSYKADIPE